MADLNVEKTGKAGSSKSDENSELNADENASTVSNASTNMSYQNDLDSVEEALLKVGKAAGEEVAERIDDMGERIDKCLDGLLEKGCVPIRTWELCHLLASIGIVRCCVLRLLDEAIHWKAKNNHFRFSLFSL